MNLKKLQEEIPFKWRVQTANAYGAMCVAFIDARQVQDVLDEHVEAGKWQALYEEHKGNLFCKIGIKIGEEWVWRSDCGTESNVEKQKGEASDAFKRAAVMWGIGRFLYSKELVKLPTKENPRKKGQYLPFCNNRFIYSGDEITKLCNDGYSTKPAQAAKPNLTKEVFDKAVTGSKEEIEATMKGFTMSEASELKLSKALEAYKK